MTSIWNKQESVANSFCTRTSISSPGHFVLSTKFRTPNNVFFIFTESFINVLISFFDKSASKLGKFQVWFLIYNWHFGPLYLKIFDLIRYFFLSLLPLLLLKLVQRWHNSVETSMFWTLITLSWYHLLTVHNVHCQLVS